MITESTWPFQITNAPPAAGTKRNSLHRSGPMSCGSSVGCLEKDDDSGQKRQRKGHKSQWHLTSLAPAPGLTSQFGAVFLGRGLSQQRGASKRQMKQRRRWTLILEGAEGSASGGFVPSGSRTKPAGLFSHCAPEAKEAESGRSAAPPSRLSSPAKSQIMQANYSKVKVNCFSVSPTP